jgi:hypothetical protein
MSNTIRQVLAVTATGILLCATGCARRKGSEELATRLLRASEIHVVFVEAVLAGYRKDALRDKRPEKEIDCVTTRITPELALPALANAYSIEFSDDELRQALSFFESEIGKAYVRYQRNLAREMSGTQAEQLPEFSPTEVERINAFAETRLGRLILTPNSPMFATAKEELRRQILAVLDECGKVQ